MSPRWLESPPVLLPLNGYWLYESVGHSMKGKLVPRTILLDVSVVLLIGA